jgi:uncharacterized protein YkwD
MRYAITVLGAMLLAGASAFFALSAVDPTDSSAATTDGYVTSCGGGSMYLNDDEKRTLDLHNRARAQHRLAPLCVHPTLVEAARSHSREMIDEDYAAHESHNGETVGERLVRFGYDWTFHGENIALGWGSRSYRSPEHMFEFWMNSPSHRPNILSSDLEEIGVGTAYGRYKGYDGETTTYTVDFGSRS